MLREANEALTADYELVGLFPIEKQIGAVYRKRVAPPAETYSIAPDVGRAVLVGE
jgi:hypothetical protein